MPLKWYIIYMIMKVCLKCNKRKKLDNFSFRKDTNKHNNTCKKCKCLISKIYCQENKEKVLEYQMLYSIENKEKIINRNKKYYQENKEEILKKNNKRRKENPNYQKENYRQNRDLRLEYAKSYRSRKDVKERRNQLRRKRRKEDVSFRLKGRVSGSIRKNLRKNGSSKQGVSVLAFLPYSIEKLKNHLESQFEDWMSWENWGVYKSGGPRTWHIDHIIPQCELPFDSLSHPNFMKCWSLNNLRPLCAMENMRRKYE